MPRFLLATIGSLGDLHPILALALALRSRGHTVTIATAESYRDKLAALALPHVPLRPDLLSQGEHIVAEIMDGPAGTVRLMRDRLFPAVRQMHADLLPAVAHHDVLVASELIFPASILAATHPIRWVSYQLAPVSLFSLHDPPILPALAPLRFLQRAPAIHRFARLIARLVSHSWWRPIRELRAELGLPPGRHPIFEGKFSPLLNLALFSRVLGAPQRDWPRNTVQPGFLFHDEEIRTDLPPALPPAVAAFLSAGDAPIVFTLGSAAIYVPGDFYATSARAAQQLGRRALLLLGKNPPPPSLPPSILAWRYLPYAQIFPRAAVIVHQGGVGTTAQALRAGRPMLVLPFAHDQFDNAARVSRLGVAREISRRHYTADRSAARLRVLLDDPRYARTAATVASRIDAEPALASACAALERLC